MNLQSEQPRVDETPSWCGSEALCVCVGGQLTGKSYRKICRSNNAGQAKRAVRGGACINLFPEFFPEYE